MTLPNMYTMNEHVNSIADEYGLLASVRILEGTESDIATDGTHIECTVTNMRLRPPQDLSKSVRLEHFTRAGVTTFDAFIRDEAAPALTKNDYR